MNPFVQHIGIWFSDIKYKDVVFDIMYDWFKNDKNICKIPRTNPSCSFYFKNGDWIRFIPCYESTRGYRFTESFLIKPETIDRGFINRIIRAKTIKGCGNIYALNDISPDGLYRNIAISREKL